MWPRTWRKKRQLNDWRSCVWVNGRAAFAWEPVIGCWPVSVACEYCIAAEQVARMQKQRSKRADALVDEHGNWTGSVRCTPEMNVPVFLRTPHVFEVCPRSDLFYEGVPDEVRSKVFDIMADNPQHRYLVFTRRPALLKEWVESERPRLPGCVWVGVSASTQGEANVGASILSELHVAGRMLRLQPILEPIRPVVKPDQNWWIIAGLRTRYAGHRRCPESHNRFLQAVCDTAPSGVPVMVLSYSENGVVKHTEGRSNVWRCEAPAEIVSTFQ